MLTLRTSRVLTIALIVVGVLTLVLGLGTGEIVSIGLGVLLTVLGALMTINPMMVVTGQEIQVKNPLGMTLKRFPAAGPQDVRLEGNKLVHVGTGKKIISLGFGVDGKDAAAVRAWADGSPSV